MADTLRTRTALQTLLADNITGDISPQDIRDFLVSTYNWVNKTVGGDIYYTEGNVGIGTTTPDSPLMVTGANFPVINGERTTTNTTGLGAAITLTRTTTGDMSDTFGGGFVIRIKDSAGVANGIGGYYASRNGADDKGKLEFLVNPGNGATGALETKMVIDSLGNVGIGTTSPSALLDVNSNILRLRTAKTPASATAAGNTGDICWDATYLYICITTNTWRRILHATW